MVMEGPLSKRGRWTHAWRKRYFELRGELWTCWVGSKQPSADTKYKHRFCMRDVDSVYENIEEVHCFHVLFKDKIDLLLRAKDAATQKKWLDSLRAAVVNSSATNATSGAAAVAVMPPTPAADADDVPAPVDAPAVVDPPAAAAAPESCLVQPPTYASVYPSLPSAAAAAPEPLICGEPVPDTSVVTTRSKPSCLTCCATKLTVKPQCPKCKSNGVLMLDTPLPKLPAFKGEGDSSDWKGSGSCFACNQKTSQVLFVIHCHECKKQHQPDLVLC